MRCPRCAAALHGVRTPPGTVWDCPAGHGRFALLGILRGLVARPALDGAWKTAFWGAPAAGARCPSCARAMAEVETAGVRVDVCRRCQALWLDRGEEQALPRPTPAEAAEAGLPQDARTTLAKARVEGMQRRHQHGDELGGAPDETWKQVAGFLGLPVEIGEMGTRRTPWVTWGLCAGLAGIFLLTLAGGLPAAIQGWGFIPDQPFRHGGLTWITAALLHAGWLHLLGNLWFLWLTGDNVEDALGRRRCLLLLVAAALAGNLCHLLGDPRAMVPCVGASGAISGVLLAYAILFPHAVIGLSWFRGLLWLRIPAWFWVVFWLAGQGVLVWQQVNGYTHVSALAHLGGAATGAGLALWWRARRIDGVAHA
ncbi:MAG: hypothetical protein RLZZ127_333 [Planctomycetota bacterium]|jgi:membrane associated rhomboid family serine protease